LNEERGTKREALHRSKQSQVTKDPASYHGAAFRRAVILASTTRLQPLISVIKLPQRLFIDLQVLGIGRDVGVRAER
jgi:hypothetical protein